MQWWMMLLESHLTWPLLIGLILIVGAFFVVARKSFFDNWFPQFFLIFSLFNVYSCFLPPTIDILLNENSWRFTCSFVPQDRFIFRCSLRYFYFVLLFPESTGRPTVIFSQENGNVTWRRRVQCKYPNMIKLEQNPYYYVCPLVVIFRSCLLLNEPYNSTSFSRIFVYVIRNSLRERMDRGQRDHATNFTFS